MTSLSIPVFGVTLCSLVLSTSLDNSKDVKSTFIPHDLQPVESEVFIEKRTRSCPVSVAPVLTRRRSSASERMTHLWKFDPDDEMNSVRTSSNRQTIPNIIAANQRYPLQLSHRSLDLEWESRRLAMRNNDLQEGFQNMSLSNAGRSTTLLVASIPTNSYHELTSANGVTTTSDVLVGVNNTRSHVRISDVPPTFLIVNCVKISLASPVIQLPQLAEAAETVMQGTTMVMQNSRMLSAEISDDDASAQRLPPRASVVGDLCRRCPDNGHCEGPLRRVAAQPHRLPHDDSAIYSRLLWPLFVEYGWIYARVPVIGDAAHLTSLFSSASVILALFDGLELGLALN
ncbi:hypothetical protein V8D89_010012 [Ganoderma adspersum]